MFPPFYFISAASFYVNFSFKNILISLVCHECLSITWIKYCRTASSKVLIKADKSPRSKHKLLFLFTKNDKGVFPTGVILRLLALALALALGFRGFFSYLSAWGAGRGQLATRWPSLLHLQIRMLGESRVILTNVPTYGRLWST